MEIESQLEIFAQNAETFIGAEDLKEKLAAGRKLRVKLGVDPTRPDLTFGHMVVFNKMRQFQDLGHQAVLIIGDYTACIGDPSGRSALRPVLTPGEVEANSRTYLEQAFKVLDESRTEVHRNSEWFSKMSFGDALELARKMTVARMLERDDFAKRYASKTPVSIVEFLYPLVQGYDSVMVESDVELGGSDQLFNNLVGRDLQNQRGAVGQAVITMPLLVGLDGEKKMSKSYNNGIFLRDSFDDIEPKIKTMFTYPPRVKKSDPGDPDACNLFPYHKIMATPEEQAEIRENCKNASLGCVQCKKIFLQHLHELLDPLQERRSRLTDDDVLGILEAGNAKAREFAAKTMEDVRRLVKIY